MSARRFLPASRRAAPVGALAAAAKPSQRQRSPSRETSRWPGLSCAARRGRVGALDDADLREAARQFGGAVTWLRERLGALRQRRIGRDRRRRRPSASAPADRPARRDRRRARRRAPSRSPSRRVRSSITGGQRFLVSTCSSLASVLASVSSRCARRSASASGVARDIERLPRAANGAASARSAAASASATAAWLPRPPRRALRDRGPSAACRALRARLRPRRARPRAARRRSLCCATALFELVAPRREVGERAGERRRRCFPIRAEHAVGLGDALVDAGALRGIRLRLARAASPLRRRGARAPPRHRRRAAARARCPRRTARAAGRARRCARLARASSRSSVSRAMTSRCRAAAGLRLGLAQRRQRGGGQRLALGGLGLLAGALGDDADGYVLGVLGLARPRRWRRRQRR